MMRSGKKIIILQTIFFLLFIFTLLLPYINENLARASIARIDILLFINSFKLNIYTFLLLAILVSHFIFGRFFCGFICPLGNLINFFDTGFKPLRKKIEKRNYILLTYTPLLVLLAAIIFKTINIPFLNYVDPLSLINRFFTTILNPVLNKIFRSELLVPGYLDFSVYIFFFILLLSFTGERIWCKFLCPMGIIYRFFSFRLKYRRVVKKCTSCDKCINICPTNAINTNDPLKYDSSMCILCFKCKDECPAKTVFHIKKHK